MTSKPSLTRKNLESAFAGESMAHIKYLHFARIARARGDEEVAKVFEETARQEVQHALGHAELLYSPATLSTTDVLKLAIDGETYEYTEMYPTFRREAEAEGQAAAVQEIDEQIDESKEHAAAFALVLEKARKRFDALARVEEKHANRYRGLLASQA
ncbi:MAG: rubrerythrin [Fibrobacteria bacterium]|nr:rubrerythrin [Fibrobacteria bacterium]